MATVNAKKTLVYKTDAQGFLTGSDDNYLVSGTPFRNQNGAIRWPLGTIVIQEQKAPTGYNVAEQETYLVTIELNEAGDGPVRKIYDKDGNELTNGKLLTIGNSAIDKTITEPTIYGGMKGSKLLLSTRDKEVGNVDLAGIRFAVVSGSANDVVVDVNMDETKDPATERFSRGQVVSLFTTDTNGNFTSSESFMPHGRDSEQRSLIANTEGKRFNGQKSQHRHNLYSFTGQTVKGTLVNKCWLLLPIFTT